MMSPRAYCGFMPPQAFETISNSAPSALITRTGNVICRMGIAFIGVESPLHRHDGQALQKCRTPNGPCGRWRWNAENAESRRSRSWLRFRIWPARLPRPVPRMMPMRGCPSNELRIPSMAWSICAASSCMATGHPPRRRAYFRVVVFLVQGILVGLVIGEVVVKIVVEILLEVVVEIVVEIVVVELIVLFGRAGHTRAVRRGERRDVAEATDGRRRESSFLSIVWFPTEEQNSIHFTKYNSCRHHRIVRQFRGLVNGIVPWGCPPPIPGPRPICSMGAYIPITEKSMPDGGQHQSPEFERRQRPAPTRRSCRSADGRVRRPRFPRPPRSVGR